MCQILCGLFKHKTIHKHHIGLLEHRRGTGGWLEGVRIGALRNKPHDVGPDVTHHLGHEAGDGGNGGHDAWCPTFDRGAHYAVLTNVFAICAAISRNITGTASQQGHASYETCANQPFVMKLHWGGSKLRRENSG